jgi:hypothetical protein
VCRLNDQGDQGITRGLTIHYALITSNTTKNQGFEGGDQGDQGDQGTTPQKMKGGGWFLGNKPPPLKKRGVVRSHPDHPDRFSQTYIGQGKDKVIRADCGV